jgi:hypothetical protein
MMAERAAHPECLIGGWLRVLHITRLVAAASLAAFIAYAYSYIFSYTNAVIYWAGLLVAFLIFVAPVCLGSLTETWSRLVTSVVVCSAILYFVCLLRFGFRDVFSKDSLLAIPWLLFFVSAIHLLSWRGRSRRQMNGASTLHELRKAASADVTPVDLRGTKPNRSAARR